MGGVAFKVDAGRKLIVDPFEHSAIHSRENARFKRIRSLHASRGVKKHGQTLVAGRRLVAEFLRERPADVEAVVVSSAADAGVPETGSGVTKLPCLTFVPELFRELDFLGAGSPLLVVRVPEIPTWPAAAPRGESGSDSQGLTGLTVFLPLSDPENLGAAIRSCAAFGADRIVLLKEAAHPFHPRALRAAAGQTWRTSLLNGPALHELNAGSLPLFALDMHGDDLNNFTPPPNFGVLVGEEGSGVPEQLRFSRLRIPMRAGVESLNAGVALGIVLYHLRRI